MTMRELTERELDAVTGADRPPQLFIVVKLESVLISNSNVAPPAAANGFQGKNVNAARVTTP
jgi:hypothetical protein